MNQFLTKVLIIMTTVNISLYAQETNEYDAKSVEHVANAINKQTAAQYKIIMTKMQNDKEVRELERKLKERKAKLLLDYNTGKEKQITIREVAKYEAEIKLAEINRSYDLKAQDSKQNHEFRAQNSGQTHEIKGKIVDSKVHLDNKKTINAEEENKRKFALEERRMEMELKMMEMKLKLQQKAQARKEDNQDEKKAERRKIENKVADLEDQVREWRRAVAKGNALEATADKNIAELQAEIRKLQNQF